MSETRSNLDPVRQEAVAFRRALEATSEFNLLGLKNFPSGSCGDGSRLLAEHLRSKSLGEWGIVTGWRSNYTESHAWLVQGDTIVDITADQFDEVDEPVFVSNSSAWHSLWQAEPVRWANVGLSYYSDDSGATADYLAIARAIEQSQYEADWR